MFPHDPRIETLPETRQRGLRVKSFRKICVDFHWHFHPEIELIYVRCGNGVRHVGKSTEPFRAGDLCLLGPNVPHAFGSDPAQRRGAEWIVGHFLPEMWGQTFWDLPEMGRVKSLLQRAGHGLRFETPAAAECGEAFYRLEKSYGAMRLSSWLELLHLLVQLGPPRLLNAVPCENKVQDLRLQDVLAWVETYASDPSLNQKAAARKVGLSPQAFCRFFLSGTGRPFHRYVNEVRVARACGELLSGSEAISEIAFRVGFNNLANFNRRFLEIAGSTPRRYRQIGDGLSEADGYRSASSV